MSFNPEQDLMPEGLEFADNPDPRAPLVIVLDKSGSMEDVRPGQSVSPIDALNNGLETLVTELHNDPLAMSRVEVSFVTFSTHVDKATPFTTVEQMVIPTLQAGGLTDIAGAVDEALDAIEARKKVYKENGVQYYRPWVLILTDGLSTSAPAEMERVTKRAADAEANKSALIFPIGIDGASIEELSRFSPSKGALMLDGVKFDELFQWVSASQSAVSSSQPGDRVALANPQGWMSIDV